MKHNFLKLYQLKKNAETGRSMVEMLGVLAIIGVLSIGGIAGYTMAMNRYRVNEILDMASKYATILQTSYESYKATHGDSGAGFHTPTFCDTGLISPDSNGDCKVNGAMFGIRLGSGSWGMPEFTEYYDGKKTLNFHIVFGEENKHICKLAATTLGVTNIEGMDMCPSSSRLAFEVEY